MSQPLGRKSGRRLPDAGGEFHQTIRQLRQAGYQPEQIRIGNPANLTAHYGEVVDVQGDDEFCKVTVAHDGLIGTAGVLPHFVTDKIVEAGPGNPLHELLDRCTETLLFAEFAAWERCHPTVGIERNELNGWCKQVLEMLGPIELEDVPLPRLIPLVKYLLRPHRSVDALQSMLNEFFCVPVHVFESSDLDRLSVTDQKSRPEQNRCWVRIRIGPLNRVRYQEFLPGNRGLRMVLELTRMFLGERYEIEVEPVMAASQVPPLNLVNDSLLMGWTTWFPDYPDGTHSTDKSVVLNSAVCRQQFDQRGAENGD